MSDVNYIEKPPILDETGKRIEDALHQIANAVSQGKGSTIYGFHIDGNESDPKEAVTYLKDAIGATPAKMNYTDGTFDYGSWENAFFMPKPCMLKSNGLVDYYLNPDDYTKKADGTASDIANTSYDGNAMMEFPKIWMKIVPSSDGNSASVYIADHKADSLYHDWPYHNASGVSVEHFYTPIYNGSVVSDKMRSLSGQAVSSKLNATQERTAAMKNNPDGVQIWDIECHADRTLINMLLVLMGKSLDTQTVFGQGLNSGGNEAINNNFRTGVHNTKGLFYGTNSGATSDGNYANAVKVFGMENYYGFQWRRMCGLINASGTIKVKNTYGKEDGSSVEGYNYDGSGYVSTGATPSGTSGGYISKTTFTADGAFPTVASGSATTYFCDGLWFNNSINAFALVGGRSYAGAHVGAFCLDLDAAASYAGWHVGAAVSCKPLA